MIKFRFLEIKKLIAMTSSSSLSAANGNWIAIDLGAENLRFAKAATLLSNGEPKISILSKSEDSTVIRAQNGSSDEQQIKCYAEMGTDGCYRFMDDQQQICLSQPEAIAALLANVRTSIFPEFLNVDSEEVATKTDEPTVNATIVVPSFADQQYRQIVRQAAHIAGFSAVQLLNQSVAVAIAFRQIFNENVFSEHSNSLAIVNIGARCVECSVLDFSYPMPKLLTAKGRVDFGGANFTEEMLNWVLQNESWRFDEETSSKKQILHVLWTACEKAKKELAFDGETCIQFFHEDEDLSIDMNLETFNRVCSAQFLKLETILRKAFVSHKPGAILLAGGSTRLQKLKQILADVAGPNCPILSVSANVPEEMAIRGAALKAAWLGYKNAPDLAVPRCFVRTIVDDFSYRKILCKSSTGHSNYLATLGTPLPVQRCNKEQLINCQQDNTTNIQICENKFFLGECSISEMTIASYRIDSSGILSMYDFHHWLNPAQFPLLLDDERAESARKNILEYEQMIRTKNWETKKQREEEQKQKEEERERREEEAKRGKCEEAERKEEEMVEMERKNKVMEEEERKKREKAEQKKKMEEAERPKREEAEWALMEEADRKGKEEAERKEMEEIELENRKKKEEANRKRILFEVKEEEQLEEEQEEEVEQKKQKFDIGEQQWPTGSNGNDFSSINSSEIPHRSMANTWSQQHFGGHSSSANNDYECISANVGDQNAFSAKMDYWCRQPNAGNNASTFRQFCEDLEIVSTEAKMSCSSNSSSADYLLFKQIDNFRDRCDYYTRPCHHCIPIKFSDICADAERFWAIGRVLETLRKALYLVQRHEDGWLSKKGVFPSQFRDQLLETFLKDLRTIGYGISSKQSLVELFHKTTAKILAILEENEGKMSTEDVDKLKALCKKSFSDKYRLLHHQYLLDN